MEEDITSLAHTKWRCQYHLVFAPKYRRKIIYGGYRAAIGKIIRANNRTNEWRKNHRSKCMRRSYTHVGNNTAKNECIEIYGDIERRK